MEAVLFRTGSGSVPVQRGSIGGVFSGGRSNCSSPNRKGFCPASSESDVIRSAFKFSCSSKFGSKSFTAGISGELIGIGSLSFIDDRRSFIGELPVSRTLIEELEFPGGGIGKNRKIGGNSLAGADRRKLGVYYEEMLKSNPTDPLLLRNYGKYLHEVEGDEEKAEEYYGRAILASPDDGELLSLYGKLIWEKEKDELRAKSYLDQAVHASPDDCMVLGSYAQFMWEVEEDDEEDEIASSVAKPAMAEATYNTI